jgi:tRNA pseudouridine32 synthase/23S rRNA pseudouridine746 synthase
MTEKNDRFTLDIAIDKPNISAVQWLSEHCDLSKQVIKDSMSKGAIWLKRGSAVHPIRRASKSLNVGEQLFFYYDINVLQQTPKIPTIIYDSPEYSVWYKPSGMFSHGSKWGDHCAITRWVEQHHPAQRPCFLIHRLDRATSGIITIAHNKKTAAALCQLFEKRLIEKRYQAVVMGEFPNTSLRIDTKIDEKHAVTQAHLHQYSSEKDYSLLDVAIETGRKHQIRKHLSSIGFPIVGDRLYNDTPIISTTPDLQLRAYHLSFKCPISLKNQCFTLPASHMLTL